MNGKYLKIGGLDPQRNLSPLGACPLIRNEKSAGVRKGITSMEVKTAD
jgi:hypothetical protein